MAFEPVQIRKLKAKLLPRHIRTREADGVTLRYVEGWHVIAEANRIFGFDGWDRETLETKCIYTKQAGNRYTAAYVSRIRISVHSGGESRVTREGSGAGEATTDSPGSAHEMALKAAETDGTKRALMTFGNQFGLSLYSNLAAEPLRPLPPNKDELRESTPPADELLLKSPGITALASAPDRHRQDAPPFAHPKGQQLGHIEKSKLSIGEPSRIRNASHLRFVASHGCSVCGKNRAHAHHLTFTQPRAMGRKVSDEFSVPLCSTHHHELHMSGNERDWWAGKNIDPLPIAETLWASSPGLIERVE